MTADPPPADTRFETLDVIRGIAVMGILVANLPAFALPRAAYFSPLAWGGTGPADIAIWFANFVLIEGKMRGLFSFLFGASMLLVIDRAGREAMQVHLWRMATLFAIGCAHLYLIWWGDILAHYALVGALALMFVALPARALVLAGIGFPGTVLLAPYGAAAVLAATLVFRIAYAGIDVPHNALLTRLGDTPARAVSLARARTVGTAIASLLAAAAAGGADRLGTAPVLWGIATGGILIGATMVPLLIAFAPRAPTHGADRALRRSLPLPFLMASVIGIVALGALAKAMLHLPMGWHRGDDGTALLTLLILGRTASALIPLRLRDARHGLGILAGAYAIAGIVAIGFAESAGAMMVVLLGLALGTTNLIGWAILPVLGAGPRGYGLYTMTSKLALGAAGLALAGGLDGVPTFTAGSYVAFVVAVGVSCMVTAMVLILPGLTRLPMRGLPRA